jgi:hypothetical protein
MTASTDIVRILTTRHTQVPLLALMALGIASANAEALRDPMRPANASVPSAASDSLRLEAILTNDGKRVAIVNGQLVRAGERVGSAKIEEILADGVRVTREGSSKMLRLPSSGMQVRSGSRSTT